VITPLLLIAILKFPELKTTWELAMEEKQINKSSRAVLIEYIESIFFEDAAHNLLQRLPDML
jgi:hypothetical protein